MVYSSSPSSLSTSSHWSNSPSVIVFLFFSLWIGLEEYKLQKRRQRATLFMKKIQDQYRAANSARHTQRESIPVDTVLHPAVQLGRQAKGAVESVLGITMEDLANLDHDKNVVQREAPTSPTTDLEDDSTNNVGATEAFHEDSNDDDGDEAWASHVLVRTKAGRTIREHLAAVDASVQRASQRECAAQSVSSYRRIICHALQKDRGAFGLPCQLPKMVAVLNLSGSRHLVYSNRYSLVRLLCLVSSNTSVRKKECLTELLTFADKRQLSILLTFALPWQSLDEAQFEVRTIARDGNGAIVDGELCFTSYLEDLRSAASTIQTDNTDPQIIKEQINTLAGICSASNLDVIAKDVVIECNENDGGRQRKLFELTTALQVDRRKLQSDLAVLRKEKQHQITSLTTQYEKRIAEITKSAEKASQSYDEALHKLRDENVHLKEKNSSLDTAVKLIKQKTAETALVREGECETMAQNFKVATSTLKEVRKTAERHRIQLEKDREKAENAYKTTIEGLEARLQLDTIEHRREKENVLSLKDELVDVRKELAEKDEAVTDALQVQKRLEKRVDELTSKTVELTKTAKHVKSVEAKRTAEVRKSAQASVSEATAQVEESRKLLTVAKSDVVNITCELEELKARLQAAEADAELHDTDMALKVAKTEADEATVRELRVQLEDMEAKWKCACDTEQAASKEVAELKDLMFKKDGELQKLRAQLEEMRAKIASHEAEEAEEAEEAVQAPVAERTVASIAVNTELYVSESQTRMEIELAERHDQAESLKREVSDLKKELTSVREQHLATVMQQQKTPAQPPQQLVPAMMPPQMMAQMHPQMHPQMNAIKQVPPSNLATPVASQGPLKQGEGGETADELRCVIEGCLTRLVGLAKFPAIDTEAERLRVENMVLRDLMRPASQAYLRPPQHQLPQPQQPQQPHQQASFGYFSSVTHPAQ
jgi:hypothetical protein